MKYSSTLTGRSLVWTTLASVLLWGRPACAYRPFDQTDAAVADPGQVELELGPLGYRWGAGARSLVAPAIVFNYAFAPNWEAVIEGKGIWPLGLGRGEPGFRVDDTGLSVKHVLREGVLQGDSGPSVALEVGTLLPTFNVEPGLGGSVLAAISGRLASLTLHGNIEAAWVRSGNLAVSVGAITEGPENWTVRPVAEAFMSSEMGSAPGFGGLLGLIWAVNPDLSLDLGFHAGAGPAGSESEIRAGLTWATSLSPAKRRL